MMKFMHKLKKDRMFLATCGMCGMVLAGSFCYLNVDDKTPYPLTLLKEPFLLKWFLGAFVVCFGIALWALLADGREGETKKIQIILDEFHPGPRHNLSSSFPLNHPPVGEDVQFDEPTSTPASDE